MNYFKKHIWLFATALLLALSFSSCQHEEVIPEESKDIVYMSFQVRFAGSKPGTRAQGTDPSINTDDTDQEDYVAKLAAMVFEAGATGAKVAEEYTSASFFKMKMKPGTYDFYFIANYPTADEASIKTMNKAALDAYLHTSSKAFGSYQGAKTPGVLFPMARVYRAQTVTEGGTFNAPLPFKPNVGAMTDKQLKPVSLFGQDWQGATTQNTINLVRANAKVELNIFGEGKTDITKIEYVNAAQNYTFGQLPEASLPGQTVTTAALPFTYTPPTGTENLVTKLYVPERLFGATETKGWNTTTDNPQGNVNYIQITMSNGKTYKIPVISNGPLSSSADNYLTFARDNSKADYNIIRNNLYYYNINIPMDAKEIEVNAVVQPWTLVESQMSYQTPVHTAAISFPNGGGEIKERQIAWLHQNNIMKISFKLMAPAGAIWSASITNGLDFEVYPALDAPGEKGAVMGITDPDVFYTMYVRPLKPYDGTPRFTEFYFLVNGQEIQTLPVYIEGGNAEVGPGKRGIIKQVE